MDVTPATLRSGLRVLWLRALLRLFRLLLVLLLVTGLLLVALRLWLRVLVLVGVRLGVVELGLLLVELLGVLFGVEVVSVERETESVQVPAEGPLETSVEVVRVLAARLTPSGEVSQVLGELWVSLGDVV